MKKPLNPLVRATLVFGVIWFVLVVLKAGRMGPPGLVFGSLIVAFFFMGFSAVQRARREKSWRLTFIIGACFAFGFMALCIFVLNAMYRQMGQWRVQQERSVQVREAIRATKLPDAPAPKFTSNIPVIVLEGNSGSMSKHRPSMVRARFYDTKGGVASVEAKPNFEGMLSMHYRGSTSMQLPKHSFTFHTMDSTTNQVKVPLLGMPAGDDWVLYASFEDKTLMRDVLAYRIFNKMGRYAPRTRFVEVFMVRNPGELSMKEYIGVYVLIEKIKRGKERVNIAKLGPNDNSEPAISGGYIVKRDHSDRNEERFNTPNGGPYFYVQPDARDLTSQQKAWLTRYFTAFENALYSDDFKDPKRGYAAYLDVDSFIDSHWLVELSKNVDGFRYSSYITKDRGAKIKPEPPWDWNRAFGNANYYGGYKENGWYSSNLRPNEISWYHRLKEDPAFRQRCNRRWFELRKNVLDVRNIKADIDGFAAELKEAQVRNFQRWPIIGTPVTCNWYVGESYEDEVAWLKKWVENRIAWIDSQLGTPENL